jgi:asparagine synthase (glutamine-hydrolysing)
LYQNLWPLRFLGKLPWQTAFDMAAPWAKGAGSSAALRRAKTVVAAWRQPNAQMLNRYWFDRYRQANVPLAEQRGVPMLDFPMQSDAASTAALWDAGTYLPDDIMVKVDRAAMANSLETRAPLLDHRIIEFAYSLPLAYKLDGGVGKRVLREVLYRHVPRQIVDRPKMGFSIPLAEWLRHELREWGEELIKSISDVGSPFNKKEISRIWNEHQAGETRTNQLWSFLMLVSFANHNAK